MARVKRRKKVSFWATKRVPKRVKVSFYTRDGKLVSFKAVKRVPKRVKVSFYARPRKRKEKKVVKMEEQKEIGKQVQEIGEVYEKRKLSVKLLLIIMTILYFFGIWQSVFSPDIYARFVGIAALSMFQALLTLIGLVVIDTRLLKIEEKINGGG